MIANTGSQAATRPLFNDQRIADLDQRQLAYNTADQPAPGVGQVVVLPHRTLQVIGGQRPLPARTGGPGPIVIYGSAIPGGVELSIGYRQDPQDREISFSLIQAGAPLTCTSIPDNGPHS